MPRPVIRNEQSIRASNQFHVIAGRFQLHDNGGAVSYLTTTMTLHEANTSLKIAPEIAGDYFTNWTVEELYQRQIDWERVSREIVPYLRAQDHLQFFSAITVALLPVIDGCRIDDMTDSRFVRPQLTDQNQFHEEGVYGVGPFTLGFYAQWQGLASPGQLLGQMRWNEEQVFAVAIDGQHRLAAIRELVRAAAAGTRSLGQTRIPVILIPVVAELGYEPPPGSGTSVQLLRKLFIDLNKHALKPSRAREILLDDYDLQSRCVRTIIGNQLTSGFAELAEAPPRRLPLSLVDWHSEQAKFDDGPYIATVLGLDWIVGTLLSLKPVRDWTSSRDIEKNLLRPLEESLCHRLPDSVRERRDATARTARPFTLLPTELSDLCERFSETVAPAIVHILTELQPYRQLISLRQSDQMASDKFAQWFSLHERATGTGPQSQTYAELRALEDHLRDQTECAVSIETWREKCLRELASLKCDINLPFTVVFQKGLFLAFDAFRKLDAETLDNDYEHDEDNEELDSDSETVGDALAELESSAVTLLPPAQRFVVALNAVLRTAPGRDVFSSSCAFEDEETGAQRKLWLGSVLSDDDTIDFSQVASKRAGDWLLLTAFFYYIAKEVLAAPEDMDLEDLMEDLADTSSGELNELQKRCSNLLEKLQRPQSAAARIARLRLQLERRADSDYDELVSEEFKARAAFFWEAAVAAACT